MVTQAIVQAVHDLFLSICTWLGSNLPSPPSWWTGATTAFNTLLGYVGAPIRAFIPFGPVLTALPLLFTLAMTLGLFKLARRLLSLMTGGGGSV